jgi:protease-4
MAKTWRYLLVGFISFLVILYLIVVIVLLFKPSSRILGIRNGIAVIRMEGIISSGVLGGGLLGEAGVSSEEVITQLRKADKDSRVAAILLRINSPGGTAAAGHEIYLQVKRTRKPVVASIGDIGASAAYWAASAADRIVADPASDVGSIGVLVSIPNYKGLLDKLGVKYVFITQGKFKDLGNPTRDLTPEEREILERQTKMIYKQFIKDVADGRGVTQAKIGKVATGLGFPGSQAIKLGLVDKLGNYQDGVDLAARLGKIKGEPVIIEYEAPSVLSILKEIFGSTRFRLTDIVTPVNLKSLIQ